MLDKEKRLDKVITFYQSLPDDLLDNIMRNLPGNRDLRRKLSKIKSSKEKVKILISSSLRKAFADTAYSAVKHLIPLELESSGYDDIINSITDENKFYVVIFFFRWCYEDSADGSSNDDKYFDIFVDSELFNSILTGEKLIDKQSATENDEPVAEAEANESTTESEIQVDNNDNNQEVDSMKLLGRIEKRNTFYNFFPQYELIEGKYVEIPNDKLKTDFPLNGGINLSYNLYSGGSSSFISELSTDFDDDQYVNNVYIVEIDSDDLEDNNNDTYQKKIDLHRLAQKGKNLCDIIQYADNCGIYKVVTSEVDNIPTNIFRNGNIDLVESNITEGEKVVLYFDEKYYGPFTANHRAVNDKFYINIGASENNYLVPFFNLKEEDIIELEKQAYYKDPTYTRFVQTSGKEKQFKDAITDEILLEKITDNISLESATKNREEFLHLCSNSPYLANIPQDIIDRRIDRLMSVINNVEIFKEKKHEVFDSLLKLYQEAPSEVSDKMITESDTFKELQAKYGEERRKNENAEKTIQELKKEQEKLNLQIIENRKSSAGTASSEEVSELNKKINELTSELEKKNKIIYTNENIKELEEEQKRLQTLNEDLIIKTNNYSHKIEELRTDVSNAIKLGKAEMASLAFDPFISSEMMKQAASWDITEEDRQYKEKSEIMSSVTPSALTDVSLIDYIVNYVKERRDYSRNDIINIYISIAQNFITIFSGEPGTGKTSICNIVAETLGLLKYKTVNEELSNRFVSVSVERGWSSKRDLIGYYNPLTKKYDKSNGKIYDALRLLDVEKNESKYPFMIMLDEANLSPMEYYWSDFMRLTDRSSENDMYINIGADHELFVPETLRFVATINTDQTTEVLSPRLIDRACIIKLPKAEPNNKNENANDNTEIITWENFIKAFSKEAELNPITQKAINEIYKLFNNYGMTVSPRISIGIEKYVMAAQEIMEDETNALAREKALDFAITQKLLPKINGYFTVYERFFDTLKQLCKEYNLNMTDEAITKIIEAQERNMGYCQYLL